jgi:hypothetical protein
MFFWPYNSKWWLALEFKNYQPGYGSTEKSPQAMGFCRSLPANGKKKS